jgi:hypothetical protein
MSGKHDLLFHAYAAYQPQVLGLTCPAPGLSCTPAAPHGTALKPLMKHPGGVLMVGSP